MFTVRGLYRSIFVCVLACLLVAGAAYLVIGKQQKLGDERAQLRRWRDIEVTVERLQGSLRDAESTQRGYLLTHQLRYLESGTAPTRASEMIESLQRLTAGMPEAPIAERIADLARQKLAELSETVELSRRGEQTQALAVVSSNVGKELMDGIRTLTDELAAASVRQNAQLVGAVDEIQEQLIADVVLISALSILLLISLTYISRRDAQRIRNAAEELAITLRSIGDAVVTTDANGFVTFLNPVAVDIGQQSLAAEPKRFAEMFMLINEITGAPAPDPIATVLRDARVIGLANHTALLRPDGSMVTIEDSAAPMLDENGRVRGVVFVFKDISERRRGERALEYATAERERSLRELRAVQEELQIAHLRKDAFLATLAHELRNPLAPIRNAIKLLENEALGIEEQRWSRSVISRQTVHMARLVDDLLDAARIHRGEIALQIGAVDLGAVVTEALDVAAPLIERKNHDLVVRLPEQPVRMRVDHVRISQVLSNLLTNAAKYTDAGGRIVLSARIEQDLFLISVNDTGVGVDARSIPHLFEMFGQVEATRDRSEGGLGIGLSLAHQLIQLHGGRLRVHSPGKGLGSEFTIELPLTVIEQGEAVPAGPAQPSAVRAGRTILIVDDNADAATSLGMLLEMSGNQVIVAGSGQQALQIMKERTPGVVILDIGLPGMDGYQVAQALRAHAQGGDLLLIALTGWGSDDDKRRAKAAGFDHHFAKPADSEEIEAAIRSHSVVSG
jgi:signal transduction histidine kinase/CHASE3 domain sensor protein/ActR/RegA family two-component response regulator